MSWDEVGGQDDPGESGDKRKIEPQMSGIASHSTNWETRE